MTYQPHPYALLLPALTEEEYSSLKADIAAHGILYPVILDEADRVLDGVHRVRIADELKIDPPVARHKGLTEERKLHLAVGLNMRRRQMDSERRHDLVRRLHDEQHLSVRAIASVTGWSKSTVARDLKPRGYEQMRQRSLVDLETLIAHHILQAEESLGGVLDHVEIAIEQEEAAFCLAALELFDPVKELLTDNLHQRLEQIRSKVSQMGHQTPERARTVPSPVPSSDTKNAD